MSEVADAFSMSRKAFFLSVEILELFFERRNSTQLNIGQLQNAAAACMLLASKVEDMRPPQAADFSMSTAGAATTRDIAIWEIHIMGEIHWQIPTTTRWDTLCAWVDQWHQEANMTAWANLLCAEVIESNFVPTGQKLSNQLDTWASACVHEQPIYQKTRGSANTDAGWTAETLALCHVHIESMNSP